MSLAPLPMRLSSPFIPLKVSGPSVPILVTANATPLATITVRAVAATNSMMSLIFHPSSFCVCDRVGKEMDASGMRRNTHADQDSYLPSCFGDVEGSRLHHWLSAPP